MLLSNGAVAGAMMGCKFGFKKLPEYLLEFPHRKWLDRKVHQFLVTIGLDDQQQSEVDQQQTQTGKERDQEEKQGEKEVDKESRDQSETVDQETRDGNEVETNVAGKIQLNATPREDVRDESQDAKENEEKVVDDTSKHEKGSQDAVAVDTRSPDQNQDQPVTGPDDQEVTTEPMDYNTTASSSAE